MYSKYCLALQINPIVLDVFEQIVSIWSFHDEFWCMMTPRNFTLCTLDMVVLFILILQLVRSIFFREGWKIIYFVLSGWRVNLLAETKTRHAWSSLLTVLARGVISLWLKKMLVSSAKSIKCKSLEELNRSFMYIRKRSGPSTEPWGTPHFI